MSKKSAHVSNKMDVKVYVEGVVVEHILVHPNMVHLPKQGEAYSLLTAHTEVGDHGVREVSRSMRVLQVIAVQVTHGVVRHRVNGSVSTELLQEAEIFCTESAPALEFQA